MQRNPLTATNTARNETPLAGQVAALRRDSDGQPPPAVAAAFSAEQAALLAVGVPEGVAAVGTAMPDGALLDTDGRPTTLARARGGRPAVVVFYRGAWCPYCNLALRTYQGTLAPELAARGIALLAVSPQKPDGPLSMAEKHALIHAVPSDPGNQIAGQRGILTAPSEDARAAQASLGVDIAAVNADGTRAVPLPTVAIVDTAGMIRWIDVHPDYTTRTDPDATSGRG